MSSRKLDDGTVEISAPVYSTMQVGHRLAVLDSYAPESAEQRRWEAAFEDCLSRLALQNAGHATHEGITVRADETALLELLEGGAIHRALVEPPLAA